MKQVVNLILDMSVYIVWQFITLQLAIANNFDKLAFVHLVCFEIKYFMCYIFLEYIGFIIIHLL